jgi:hypothetical protein
VNYLFKFFVVLFLISCIFDPADKLFGLKVPLFISLWLLFLISKKSVNLRFPIEIVLFSLLFLAIPILSISYYLIFDGTQPYAGFSLFKSFLFISLVFILYDKKMNIIPLLAQILSLLSLSIILVYIVILKNPGLFYLIYEFGYNSGVFHIGERVYSSNLKLWSIFFVTSPMIIIAIAYYFDLAFKSRKFKYYFLLLINVFAMFIAGTRNNMLMSILLPTILFIIYLKNTKLVFLMVFSALFVGSIYISDSLSDLLSTEEESNKTKIGFLDDYKDTFSDPKVLIFGEGLGAYKIWNSNGRFYFTSELTYFEIFRYFGVFLGLALIYLMFYPVLYSYFNRKHYKENHIIIAYFLYLIMSFTNPLFFSSLGMLIFAILLANIFTHKYTLIKF